MASPLITFLLFIILFAHIVDARVRRRLFTPNADDYTYPSSTLPHTPYDTTSTHPNPSASTVYYANNHHTYPSSTLPHTSSDTTSTHPNPSASTVYYANNHNTYPSSTLPHTSSDTTSPHSNPTPSTVYYANHNNLPYQLDAPLTYGKTFPYGRVVPSSTSGISHTQPLEDSTPNSLAEESSSDRPLENTLHNLKESPFYAPSHQKPLDRNYFHYVQMDFPTNFNPHTTSTSSVPTRDAATPRPFSKSSAMRDAPLYESSPLNGRDVTTYGEVNVP